MVPAGPGRRKRTHLKARTNAEFDAGKEQANDWCRIHRGVPSRYVARTVDVVRFERLTVAETAPMPIQPLSLRHGISQGQERGLRMSYGNDLAKFQAAAERLRKR